MRFTVFLKVDLKKKKKKKIHADMHRDRDSERMRKREIKCGKILTIKMSAGLGSFLKTLREHPFLKSFSIQEVPIFLGFCPSFIFKESNGLSYITSL